MKREHLFGAGCIALECVIIVAGMLLRSCSATHMNVKQLESAFTGIQATIRTFDEESNIIDTIKGKSVMVKRGKKFDTSNSEGSNKDS